MPAYDYKCTSCGYTEEVRHSIHASPDVNCKICDAQLQRQIGPVPSHFKGRGWASDNYSKDSS